METLFTDGITANTAFSKIKISYENAMYNEINQQAENDPYIDWGAGLNVLLISDSALGRALGLFLYISTKTSFKGVKFCMDIDQIEEYLNSTIPDIIIYVGIQDKIENYHAIPMAQRKNRQVMVAMFDFLDDVIESECINYRIRYAFSSNKRIRDGLLYLKQAFEDNKKTFKTE